MHQPAAWIDRVIDTARSHRMLYLLGGVILGWLLFYRPLQPDIMLVTFHNQSDMLIHSIHLEFGFDLNQSDLRIMQIRPDESRTIAINHVPGRGFNTEVSYADGTIQSFCANRGVTGQHQNVVLQP
ncbi:MAG: hypothetical protein GXZ05_12340 [Gammaproteobacteria bacterium]|jgi:hypothetical protein|nr:hypothetical protein [Gammaproteobacteria bacterium]